MSAVHVPWRVHCKLCCRQRVGVPPAATPWIACLCDGLRSGCDEGQCRHPSWLCMIGVRITVTNCGPLHTACLPTSGFFFLGTALKGTLQGAGIWKHGELIVECGSDLVEHLVRSGPAAAA